MHALSGIRTRDIKNQATADLRLGPHGHRDRHFSPITKPKYSLPFSQDSATRLIPGS
jgi:hypothetical protein